MKQIKYLNSIEEELKQRLSVLNSNDINKEERCWEESIEKTANPDYLRNARKYLQSISLDHKGLTTEQYFAHCYRVSALGINFSAQDAQKVGIIGLIHNVYEVSNVEQEEIEKKFGAEISECLSVLKIDRNQQWDGKYLERYYENIYKKNSYLFRVKVVDKLDNLFMLGLNPNDEVRRKYLEEITMYILPLAKKIDDSLAGYMVDLIKFSLETGFFTKQKFIQ